MAHSGEKGNACRLLDEAPEGKRPLGRYKHRWGPVKLSLKIG